MFRLMLLEIQKHRLTSLLKGVVIANGVTMLFLTLIHYVEKANGAVAFESSEQALHAVHALVRPTMIMFAYVLSVKLIVEELKTRTMSLVFLYPISRSKVMLAKMVMVILFAFASIVLTNLILGGLIIALNPWIGFVPETFSGETVASFLTYLIPDVLAISGIVLVPLFVGLLKYSVPSTFVTAVIIMIAFLTSFGAHPLFAPALGILGVIGAPIMVRKTKYADM